MLLASQPVYVAEGVKEFNTFEDCVRAVLEVKDERIRPRLLCVKVDEGTSINFNQPKFISPFGFIYGS